MYVMSAGMHYSGILRRKFKSRHLRYGKRIKLRAESRAFSAVTYCCNNSRTVGKNGVIYVILIKNLRNVLDGPPFLRRKLRESVYVAADL